MSKGITVEQICTISTLLDRGVITTAHLRAWLESRLAVHRPLPNRPLKLLGMIAELAISQEEAELEIMKARRGNAGVGVEDVRTAQARILWESGLGGRLATFADYLRDIPAAPSPDRFEGKFGPLTLIDRRLEPELLSQIALCKLLGVTVDGRTERDLETSHQGAEKRTGVYWIRTRLHDEPRDPSDWFTDEVDCDVVEAATVALVHPEIWPEHPDYRVVLVHGCDVDRDGDLPHAGWGLKMTRTEYRDEGKVVEIKWSSLGAHVGDGRRFCGEMTRIAY